MSPTIGINLPNESYDPETTRRYLYLFKENGFDAVEICLDTYPLIIDGHINEAWVEYVDHMFRNSHLLIQHISDAGLI